MAKVADLMILNTLWLLCCLPIVTIGASTSALYYASLKIVRKEDTYPSRMFFHSFKQNLKQGTLMTLIFLVLAVFLFFDLQIVKGLENQFGNVLSIIFTILAVVLCMIVSYAFPVLAQFDNTTKHVIKNAFLMSITHLGNTILIVILNVLPWAMLLKLPELFVMILPFWLLLGFSLIVRINSRMFVKIFNRYIPAEENEEAESEDEAEDSDFTMDVVEENPAGIPVTPIFREENKSE